MRSPANPYRVFIIDDSRTIRRLIGAIVDETEGLTLVGSAESAEEAWEILKNPAMAVDVISLDIELPGINGIEFLRRLMGVRPIPVLVVSGHTDASADLTLTALETGAIDCIQKPDGRPDEIDRFIADTADGLMRAAQSNHRARAVHAAPVAAAIIAAPPPASPAARPAGRINSDAIICIGASTGGVPAVCKVVASLVNLGLPIVVVQHMPPTFTGRLAARLAQTTGRPAQEARDNERLVAGTVWVAPGGRHLRISRKLGGYVANLSDEMPVSGHKPSIDVMFDSASRQAGANGIGVILTGMGRDGAEGLLAMHEAGAFTIAQDEESSVVFGMPKVAAAIGAADQILPLDRIADGVLAALGAPRPHRSPRFNQGVRHG